MASLGATAARIRQLKRAAARDAFAGASRLTEAPDFGENPGALRLFSSTPRNLGRGAPLVVALHGCTQTAASYDRGTGWSTLADQLGFSLLCPEQTTANNFNRCFNWFQGPDSTRGCGEAASIRQMIEHVVNLNFADRGRVFITGFSAGGAMSAAMLALYPEVFAAGAIVAGLPFRAADNLGEAFASMMQARSRTGGEWGDVVRRASKHAGSWPRVSIWRGSADAIVSPANAEELTKQWRDVHAVSDAPDFVVTSHGRDHRIWRGVDGSAAVESHTIHGMGHGVSLNSADPGAPGPFFIDVGISSTLEIARFWGLAEGPVERRELLPRASDLPVSGPPAPQTGQLFPEALGPDTARATAGGLRGAHRVDVLGIINRALTSAGLMK